MTNFDWLASLDLKARRQAIWTKVDLRCPPCPHSPESKECQECIDKWLKEEHKEDDKPRMD